MNPYIIHVECSVCGGPAMARPQDAWFPGVHRDSRICVEYLAERERKLAKREAEVAEKEAALS
jgi:hypothetical protein